MGLAFEFVKAFVVVLVYVNFVTECIIEIGALRRTRKCPMETGLASLSSNTQKLNLFLNERINQVASHGTNDQGGLTGVIGGGLVWGGDCVWGERRPSVEISGVCSSFIDYLTNSIPLESNI
jgi:hypothetical protein